MTNEELYSLIENNSRNGVLTETYCIHIGEENGVKRNFIALGFNEDKEICAYFFDRPMSGGLESAAQICPLSAFGEDIQQDIIDSIGKWVTTRDAAVFIRRTEVQLNSNLPIIDKLGLFKQPVDDYNPWEALKELEEGSYVIDRSFHFHKAVEKGNLLLGENIPVYYIEDTEEYVHPVDTELPLFENTNCAHSSNVDLSSNYEGYGRFNGTTYKYIICKNLAAVTECVEDAFYGGQTKLYDEDGHPIDIMKRAYFFNKSHGIPFSDIVKNAKNKLGSNRGRFLVFSSLDKALEFYNKISEGVAAKFEESADNEDKLAEEGEEKCAFKSNVLGPIHLEEGGTYILCSVDDGSEEMEFKVTKKGDHAIETDKGIIILREDFRKPIVNPEDKEVFEECFFDVKQILIHKGNAKAYRQEADRQRAFKPFYDNGVDCPWRNHYEVYQEVSGYGHAS